MRRVYCCRYCDVHIYEGKQEVYTVFTDGAICPAIPQLDAESITRARELGYHGTDEEVVWEMTRWHDLLHTMLAEMQGEPWSPTLHAVAHGDYKLAPGVVEREERLVLGVQRLLARGVPLGEQRR